MGMGHPSMFAGQLLIGEPHSAALHEAIVMPSGDTHFQLLKVFTLWLRPRGMSHP